MGLVLHSDESVLAVQACDLGDVLRKLAVGLAASACIAAPMAFPPAEVRCLPHDFSQPCMGARVQQDPAAFMGCTRQALRLSWETPGLCGTLCLVTAHASGGGAPDGRRSCEERTRAAALRAAHQQRACPPHPGGTCRPLPFATPRLLPDLTATAACAMVILCALP